MNICRGGCGIVERAPWDWCFKHGLVGFVFRLVILDQHLDQSTLSGASLANKGHKLWIPNLVRVWRVLYQLLEGVKVLQEGPIVLESINA